MHNNSSDLLDIMSVLVKIQDRLVSLESKIDALAGKGSPSRLLYSTPPQEKVQRPVHADQGNAGRQENRNNRVRPMFKAICADCNKECEVPFKPSGDRPVYCQGCFSRRKAGNSLRTGMDSRPKETPPAQVNHIDEKQVSEPVKKKKPVVKKRPAAKVIRKPKKRKAG
jgi:CxxC-x17-CxxC domain-containing protein